jgi:hypothetical protein
MNNDIIRMAREAGAIHIHKSPKEFAVVGNEAIERFAALVRIDEREKRDEAIELLRTIHMGNESARSQDIIRAAIHVLQRNAPEELAAAFLARGNVT